MDDASLTVSLAMIAGVLAQGLAVHLRVPGIVLLLATGVVLGPDVANVVRPHIMGGGLQAFVGFAVAIILFGGGLSMNLKRLRRQAVPIRRLVTIGAIVTAIGATLVARLVMPGWDWRLSLLFGTLVIVTGPTVITPLVRRLKLEPGIATILEAEGIFIDAIGATIAVVALEAALVWSPAHAVTSVFDVLLRLGSGALVGLAGGALLAVLIRTRDVVPQGLENILALAFAVATFQVANSLVHESGITAAIVAGMVISNTQSHAFDDILDFKEQLTSFFVAALFVLLAADVRLEHVAALGVPGIVTVVLLMVAVRPATVLISTFRSGTSWREKLFLCWLSPRGIVAAAVASLFAIRLTENDIDGGVEMRALVFLVIATTVTLQGISGGPIASLLGLRRARNVGFLLLGANPLARHLARRLRDYGEPVVLIDRSADACRAAEEEGLDVIYGNGLDQGMLLRGHVEARKAVVGLTPNESINFLFARKVRDSFKDIKPFVGLAADVSGVNPDMVEKAHGRILFGGERPLGMWVHLVGAGQLSTELWELAEPGGEAVNFGDAPPNAILPLLGFRDRGPFLIDRRCKMKKGDRLEVLIRPEQAESAHAWLRDHGFAPGRAPTVPAAEAS